MLLVWGGSVSWAQSGSQPGMEHLPMQSRRAPEHTPHPPPVVRSSTTAPRRKPDARHAHPAAHPQHPGKPEAKHGTTPAAEPVATHAAKPPAPAEADKGTSTGLPLPRFAALRTDEVNMRAGPGMRYPIEWRYQRRYLPVEIEREFDVWRLVQAPDGARGWVHQATLTGRRSFLVQHHDATIRAEPRDDAEAVAILKPGVVGRIRSCAAKSDWCRVWVGDYGGYLRRQAFWGTLPHEAIEP